jgi:hypothetical protein
VKLVFQGSGDPEVATATPHAPEEIGVLRSIALKKTTVGGDDVQADQIVEGQAVRPYQNTKPTPESKAGDASWRSLAESGGQSEGLGLTVELAEKNAGFGSDCFLYRIDADALHQRKVNHETGFTD